MARRRASLICPYCEEPFTPYYRALKRQTKHCAKRACIQAHKRKLENKSLPTDQKGERERGICLVCGDSYIKTTSNRKTCGSTNCQIVWGRRLTSDSYKKRREEDVTQKSFHICPVCGKPHQHKSGKKTCGSQVCVRAWKIISDKKRKEAAKQRKITPPPQLPLEKERTCLKCDKIFYSDTFRLCPKCKRENEELLEW